MDDLIIRRLSGAATDIELRTLARWRAESPDNERAYREVQRVWNLASDEETMPVAAPPALETIAAEAEARRRRLRSRNRRWRVVRSPWVGYGLATAAVLAVMFVSFGRQPDEPRAPLLRPIESTASGADVVTMSLSDGSVVRLAASTTIEFPPEATRREVVLDGRAFFAVSEDQTPFVVRTAMADVVVHGTRFEVTVSDDGLRLIVVEGTVSLAGPDGSAIVDAHHVAYLSPGTGLRVVARDDVWSLMRWPSGLLVFQATPLVDVAEELRRHFGRDVSLAAGLESRRITAWFSDESLEEVVAAVCLIAAANCEIGPASVTIED
jgi:transmembrane sensor